MIWINHEGIIEREGKNAFNGAKCVKFGHSVIVDAVYHQGQLLNAAFIKDGHNKKEDGTNY